MNADSWPLNLALAALAVCLAAMAVWLLISSPSEPDWLSPMDSGAPAFSAPKVTIAASPDLDTFANTWQSPLFSPSRTPDNQPEVNRASPDLAGVKLTGVILGGDQRVALLKQADGRDLKVIQGASLPNGWMLKRVEPLAAYFEYNGNVRELQLPAPRVQTPAQNGVPPKVPSAQQ